jgi:hypothetical protein
MIAAMKAVHLQGKIRSLNKQMIGEILRMILNATPNQLVQLAAMTSSQATPPDKKKAKRPTSKTATRTAVKAPRPSQTEQNRKRLPTGTAEQVKNGIILVLQEADGPLTAKAIAIQMNSGVTSEQLALPIQSLRRSGHLSKVGERSRAVYSLAERQVQEHSHSRL